jgi:sugar phosphate isomerase/epimerase
MPKRLSFQLYSARNLSKLPDTLALIAKVGFTEVEGFGGVYDDPKALRNMMDAHGLTMPTGHFSLDLLEKEKSKALSIARTLGVRHIVAPYIMPDQRPKNAAGWTKFGKRLAAIGQWARSEGFGFAWHNHDFEYKKIAGGKTPHELIYAAAPLLDWEIDVAWVVRGGINPLPWIKKYADRITAVHVKDIAPKGKNLDEDGWADVGKGTMDWKKIIAACGATRAMHYVVEHDNPNDLERFARRSFDYVKKI